MSTKRNTVLAVIVCAAVGVLIGTLARRPAPSVVMDTSSGQDPMYHQADVATARAINDRAAAYWQARTRQDLYAAYPFYDAGFRSTYPPEAFVKTFQRLNRFAPVLVGIDRIDIDASGTRAKIRVTLRSNPGVLDGKELISTTEDVWILADGAWWRQAEAMVPVI